MRKILALLLTGLLFLGAAPSQVSSPYGYPWRGQVPVTVTIADHTSPEWRPFIEQSALDWSLSPVIDVVVLPSDNKCSAKGKVTMCNGLLGLGTQGVAWTIYDSRNGMMVDAAVSFNNSITNGYINADGIPIPAYTNAQKQYLVCHEMGHTLGILAEGICALGSVPGAAWQEHPQPTDYDRLLSIYGVQ